MHPIFSNIESFGDRTAIIDELGQCHSYQDVAKAAERSAGPLQQRPGLALIEISNRIDSIVAFIGTCRAGIPVILTPPDPKKTAELKTLYEPEFIYTGDQQQWEIRPITRETPPHPDLGLLLSTSGSSGKAKLVRLSKANIRANATSIIEYLQIDAASRAITALPVHYSFGLSILTSHLAGGASIVLTDASVLEDRFWHRFETHKATSFSGVPRSFQLLAESGFLEKTFPTLKTITQAGGRLAPEYIRQFARYAEQNDARFFVMYGQTEASPRISYLPPEKAHSDPDSIGIPIPGGTIELVDEDGAGIEEDNLAGELCYRGPNVMMGYAASREDLSKGNELSILHTGDLAIRKPNGLYQIVGRKSRFVKLAGVRVGLDDVEAILRSSNLEVMVAGDDNKIVIALGSGNIDSEEVRRVIAERYQIPKSLVRARHYTSFPTLPSGKPAYRAILEEGSEEATDKRHLQAQFFALLDYADGNGAECFLTSGGDSLNFLEASILVEKYHGRKVPGWEHIPFSRLFEDNLREAPREHQPRDYLAVGRALAIGLLLCAHAFEEFDVWRNLGHFFEFATRAATPSFFLIFGLGLARIHMDRPERNNLRLKILHSFPKVVLVYLYLLLLQVSFLLGQQASLEQIISVLTLQDPTRYSDILVTYGLLYLLSPYFLLLLERSKWVALLLCIVIPWAVRPWIVAVDTDVFLLQILCGANAAVGSNALYALTFVCFGYFLGGWKKSATCRQLVAGLIAMALIAVSAQIATVGLREFALGITSAELRFQTHPAYYGYGILAGCGLIAFASLLARISQGKTALNIFFGLGDNSIFAFTLGCMILNLIPHQSYGVLPGIILSLVYIAGLTVLTYDVAQPQPGIFGPFSRGLQKIIAGLFSLSRLAAPGKGIKPDGVL